MGEGAVLRTAIESGNIQSMIFWGPPGVGKTTLALLIAQSIDAEFFTLSAISSGVKDIREVIDKAKKSEKRCILFIDEIHRFSKSQQDSLLGAVEQGVVTLIGATTENPSFEVISPTALPLPSLCAERAFQGKSRKAPANGHRLFGETTRLQNQIRKYGSIVAHFRRRCPQTFECH